MLKKILLITCILLPSITNALTIKKVSILNSAGSSWGIETDKGQGTVKNLLSSGGKWLIKLPHASYTLTRVSSDNTWTLTKKGESGGYINDKGYYVSSPSRLDIKPSFKNDLNEWRTGSPGKWLRTKTAFKNNFKEWKSTIDQNEVLIIKAPFTDLKEWQVTDKGINNEKQKLLSTFIAIKTALDKDQ